jgi:hypothetical protein
MANHFIGRHREPIALPRIVSNAFGGLVVDGDFKKLRLFEEGGYEVASTLNSEAVG